jgi:hypothetical protein
MFDRMEESPEGVWVHTEDIIELLQCYLVTFQDDMRNRSFEAGMRLGKTELAKAILKEIK